MQELWDKIKDRLPKKSNKIVLLNGIHHISTIDKKLVVIIPEVAYLSIKNFVKPHWRADISNGYAWCNLSSISVDIKILDFMISIGVLLCDMKTLDKIILMLRQYNIKPFKTSLGVNNGVVKNINNIPTNFIHYVSNMNYIDIGLYLPYNFTCFNNIANIADTFNTLLAKTVSEKGEAYYTYPQYQNTLGIVVVANETYSKDDTPTFIKILNVVFDTIDELSNGKKPKLHSLLKKTEQDELIKYIHIIAKDIVSISVDLYTKSTIDYDKTVEYFAQQSKVDVKRPISATIILEETLKDKSQSIKYKTKNIGRVATAVAVLDKSIEPSKTVRFDILFNSDQYDVMQYGPNGLHYLEHILCNVIEERGNYPSYNAVTFDDGLMGCYYIFNVSDIEKNIKAFFTALTSVLIPSNYSKFDHIYTREQRRVTSETADFTENSGQPSMFLSNTEMYRGEFPYLYIWHMLIYQCRLEKIVMVADDSIPKTFVDMFHDLGKKFLKAWDNRYSINMPKITIPNLKILPYSATNQKKTTLKKAIVESSKRTISLSHIDNVIVRNGILSLIQQSGIGTSNNSYNVDIILCDITKKITPKQFIIDINTSSPHWIAPYLLATGNKLEKEWIDDLHNLSNKEISVKYRKIIIDTFKQLI